DDLERRALDLASEFVQRPFDLDRAPLVRAIFIAAGRHRIMGVVMHHIVSDGEAIEGFLRELAAFYQERKGQNAAPVLPGLKIQYADYSAWQREWLQGRVLDEQLEYWRRALTPTHAPLDLPTDRARPPVQTFNGSIHSFKFRARAADAVMALRHSERATSFM